MNAVDTQRMKSAQMVAHARMNGLQAQIARLESAVDGSTLADEAQCDEEVRQIAEIIKGYISRTIQPLTYPASYHCKGECREC
jgi:hypothetical protein